MLKSRNRKGRGTAETINALTEKDEMPETPEAPPPIKILQSAKPKQNNEKQISLCLLLDFNRIKTASDKLEKPAKSRNPEAIKLG